MCAYPDPALPLPCYGTLGQATRSAEPVSSSVKWEPENLEVSQEALSKMIFPPSPTLLPPAVVPVTWDVFSASVPLEPCPLVWAGPS